jgi:hypothetical protein
MRMILRKVRSGAEEKIPLVANLKDTRHGPTHVFTKVKVNGWIWRAEYGSRRSRTAKRNGKEGVRGRKSFAYIRGTESTSRVSASSSDQRSEPFCTIALFGHNSIQFEY